MLGESRVKGGLHPVRVACQAGFGTVVCVGGDLHSGSGGVIGQSIAVYLPQPFSFFFFGAIIVFIHAFGVSRSINACFCFAQ